MYDRYYEKPDWWFRFRYDTQVKRKTCMYLLRQAGRSLAKQRVLEIGFGSGAVLFSFENSCEIYGMEISRSAISRAEQKARRLGYKMFGFEIAENELLPHPDEHFDVVIASHVIEHVADDKRLLKEISRVLKQDGVAITLIPINEAYDDPNHLHRYTDLTFVELAKGCALTATFCLENELLFHVVEKFYFEGYNYRLKVLGPIMAALFNFPTSILPFWGYRMIDQAMIALGWKPRQLGCVLIRPVSLEARGE